MPMSSRERWLALFTGQKPDRVPTDYWSTPEFHAKIKAHLGVESDDDLWAALHVDKPRSLGAKHKHGGRHPTLEGCNMWGLKHQRIDYEGGSYSENANHPLEDVTTVEQIHAYPWPDPDDMDYSQLKEAADALPDDRVVTAGAYEPFLLYCHLRGMEQAYMDLIDAPEIAEAGLGRIFEFVYEVNRRTWEITRHRVDMFYLAEDLGAQTGPLFSLDAYRRFLLPNQVAMAKLARDYGIRTFYHTDGAAQVFLRDLVDTVGIDVLNPIQWRCPGMEREVLASKWGDRIIFHGAIDNQQTLAFGTVDDVVAEVNQTREIFRDCRWICAPCHNIQPVSPPENVVAMFETIHKIG